MSDEDLEQDELESADEEETEELEAADDGVSDDDSDDDGDEDGVPAAKKSKAKAKAAIDVEALPSVEAKQKERDALARAMEEFLSRGGKVQEVDVNVVADPPKKPDSKYGSRPI
ncbi:MAG: transcriptional regulator SutA [Pseudomonas sp.]|uniref:transcriptional regulator SutA n=1 Tax=Pseudomonas sp. TaxID=306 RepID=UPI002733A362|nr:transcriptional regulator SutA [Pseudomonas sp.]MDP3848443.1 transcriptional regulator SutA [Pseudomonas sp.]